MTPWKTIDHSVPSITHWKKIVSCKRFAWRFISRTTFVPPDPRELYSPALLLWIAQHSEMKPALSVILPNLIKIEVSRSSAGNLLPPPSLSQHESLSKSAASRSAPAFESWRTNQLLHRQAISYKDMKNRLKLCSHLPPEANPSPEIHRGEWPSALTDPASPFL